MNASLASALARMRYRLPFAFGNRAQRHALLDAYGFLEASARLERNNGNIPLARATAQRCRNLIQAFGIRRGAR